MRLVFPVLLLLFTACTSNAPQDSRHTSSAAASSDKQEAQNQPLNTAAPSGIEVPPAAEGEPQNPLQVEMRALTAFMQLALVAVANDQLDLIPPAISKLHGAIEDTQDALKEGKMKLPQHPEEVDAFLAMDDAFHEQLVILVKAARENDLPLATRQLANLSLGCTSCHQRYRFPEKTAE